MFELINELELDNIFDVNEDDPCPCDGCYVAPCGCTGELILDK